MMFRYLFMILGAVLVVSARFVTDPLGGAMTVDWLIRLSAFVVGVGCLYVGFRALSDYKEANGEELHKVALKEPTGAGLALVYRGLALVALAIVFSAVSSNANAQDVRTYIPKQAPDHLPVMVRLQAEKFPQMPTPWLMAGMTEKESCVTLTHSRCWNATSRLKSAREEGAGLGQITRAYRPNGSLRFDALAELKARHPELSAWTWGNVYQRPDMQVLAIVLKIRDNWGSYHAIKDPDDRIRFAIKANNRGVGGVNSELRVCGLTKGCDPQKFAGGAGEVCTASKKPIYGTRSACDISLAYIPGIEVRAPKYRVWFS